QLTGDRYHTIVLGAAEDRRRLVEVNRERALGGLDTLEKSDARRASCDAPRDEFGDRLEGFGADFHELGLADGVRVRGPVAQRAQRQPEPGDLEAVAEIGAGRRRDDVMRWDRKPGVDVANELANLRARRLKIVESAVEDVEAAGSAGQLQRVVTDIVFDGLLNDGGRSGEWVPRIVRCRGQGVLDDIARLDDFVGGRGAAQRRVDDDQLANGVSNGRLFADHLPAHHAAHAVRNQINLADGVAGQVLEQAEADVQAYGLHLFAEMLRGMIRSDVEQIETAAERTRPPGTALEVDGVGHAEAACNGAVRAFGKQRTKFVPDPDMAEQAVHEKDRRPPQADPHDGRTDAALLSGERHLPLDAIEVLVLMRG